MERFFKLLNILLQGHTFKQQQPFFLFYAATKVGWSKVIGGIVAVVLLIVAAGAIGFVVGVIKSKEKCISTVLEEIPLQTVSSGNYAFFVFTQTIRANVLSVIGYFNVKSFKPFLNHRSKNSDDPGS